MKIVESYTHHTSRHSVLPYSNAYLSSLIRSLVSAKMQNWNFARLPGGSLDSDSSTSKAEIEAKAFVMSIKCDQPSLTQLHRRLTLNQLGHALDLWVWRFHPPSERADSLQLAASGLDITGQHEQVSWTSAMGAIMRCWQATSHQQACTSIQVSWCAEVVTKALTDRLPPHKPTHSTLDHLSRLSCRHINDD